ncbi:hypothetical protein PFISCL1PPCAC_88 [Pristionchus fissidentatus]|uniref:Gamma-glutamyltranspeptidase n=1 Tax=Pristionchus fissidentatus TaxID=1538716 RepID=A0AAV5UNZ7_9BILA|nr:hypothetical protein PFISCL1PPCAC_88 [Pristionchus fissidentatus]
MFTNPATNEFYKEGETMYRPNLAKTLQRLADAEDPTALFYRGDMAQTIPSVKDGVTSSISPSLTQCGPPPPSSWIVTQLIVKVMGELYPEPRCKEDLESVLFYHRLLETEKFAYALRTKLGDPYYVGGMDEMIKNLTDPFTAKMIASKISDEGPLPIEQYAADGYMKEDHGTAHVSVIDEQGNAVSVTSTINYWLGSKVASSLGIIWNCQIDDFSVQGQTNGYGFHASSANLIQPGKTPMSSTSPTIIYNNDDNQVRVVIGTTGGSLIIQGVASIVIRSLLFGESIKEAIDAPQIFDQMTTPYVQYEDDFSQAMIEALRAKGHVIDKKINMHSTTHALFVNAEDKYIYANSDKRGNIHMHPDGY